MLIEPFTLVYGPHHTGATIQRYTSVHQRAGSKSGTIRRNPMATLHQGKKDGSGLRAKFLPHDNSGVGECLIMSVYAI